MPHARVVSCSDPSYLGVTESTRSLFGRGDGGAWFPVAEADVATRGRARRWVDAVLAAEPEQLVVGCLPPGLARALRMLRAERPALRIAATWHGSVLQNVEAENWAQFRDLLELVEAGVVDRVGFLKEGFADLLGERVAGFPLRNFVDAVPERASHPPDDGRIHLGIWSAGQAWRKNPHAMLAAASLVEGAVVSGRLDAGARAFASLLGLATLRIHDRALRRDDLLRELARQHCNLYVTLSECSPLIPLESASVGAPCLVGPNSHLFRDASGGCSWEGAAYLSEVLVVSRIDEPEAIARAIERVVRERGEVASAYARFAVHHNRWARELRDRFLAA